MNNHHLGRLPTTRRHGVRVRNDDVLVYEASAVLRAAINRAPRGVSRMGFHVDVDWLSRHLDDDPILVQRVLTGSGFAPNESGSWVWRGGNFPLSKITDLDALGDALVNLVDIHRPV